MLFPVAYTRRGGWPHSADSNGIRPLKEEAGISEAGVLPSVDRFYYGSDHVVSRWRATLVEPTGLEARMELWIALSTFARDASGVEERVWPLEITR